MGVPLLQKTINKLGYMKKVEYIYNHKHIIIDMNNQIYKILQLHRKTLTPLKKFQIILSQCQKLINISKQRNIKFYIVLDQMIYFSQYFEYDFAKEYSFLKPYSVKIANGFVQVHDQDNKLHAINILSKINYIKPQLEKKILKNKKDAAELMRNIQNGGVVKNDNYGFLLASKYNYYLYETIFNNVPNIEIHVANTEADFKIAQIAKRLIDQGIPPSDICIHSQDSDLLILQTGVDIQQNILCLSRDNDISSKLKYYYLHSSDYVQRTIDGHKTILEELANPTTEEERKNILLKACENRELNILIADMLFQHYEIFENSQQYLPVKREEIKQIQHIKLVFEIYEQFQFNTYFQNIQQIKKQIQQNPYFQEVMDDKWVNSKLSQKERLLKMYFQDQITYQTLIERQKQMEERQIQEQQLQTHRIRDHQVVQDQQEKDHQPEEYQLVDQQVQDQQEEDHQETHQVQDQTEEDQQVQDQTEEDQLEDQQVQDQTEEDQLEDQQVQDQQPEDQQPVKNI